MSNLSLYPVTLDGNDVYEKRLEIKEYLTILGLFMKRFLNS